MFLNQSDILIGQIPQKSTQQKIKNLESKILKIIVKIQCFLLIRFAHLAALFILIMIWIRQNGHLSTFARLLNLVVTAVFCF